MDENESPYYEKGGRYLWAFAADDIVSPLHLHEEAEFMCCLEGSFHATVMDESRTVTAGDCALMVGPESEIFAADFGKIEKVRVLREYRESANPSYPELKCQTFREVFQERLFALMSASIASS